MSTGHRAWCFFIDKMNIGDVSIYKTAKWQKKRAIILRRDKYKSVLAARYGRSVQAEVVHHILPVEFFPEYAFCNWNLISVTKDEHNKLHDRNSHRLTDAGIELAIRTARRQGLNINKIKERLDESQIQEENL